MREFSSRSPPAKAIRTIGCHNDALAPDACTSLSRENLGAVRKVGTGVIPLVARYLCTGEHQPVGGDVAVFLDQVGRLAFNAASEGFAAEIWRLGQSLGTGRRERRLK